MYLKCILKFLFHYWSAGMLDWHHLAVISIEQDEQVPFSYYFQMHSTYDHSFNFKGMSLTEHEANL